MAAPIYYTADMVRRLTEAGAVMTARAWLLSVLAGITLGAPGAASAQQPSRGWIAISLGGGGQRGDGTIYKAGPVVAASFDAGARIIGRLGIQGSFDLSHDASGQGYDLAYQGPARYGLKGFAGGLTVDAGPARDPAVLRLGFGAGAYTVQGGFPLDLEVTKLGLRLAADLRLATGRRTDLFLGFRPVLVPDAIGETLWMVPLVLTGRLRM
jgi:hypothetical protein